MDFCKSLEGQETIKQNYPDAEINADKLLSISLTKKRLQNLRAVWRNYKNNHPYNPGLLKLVTIDFAS